MAQSDDPKPDPLMEALSNEREPAIEPPPSFINIGRYISSTRTMKQWPALT